MKDVLRPETKELLKSRIKGASIMSKTKKELKNQGETKKSFAIKDINSLNHYMLPDSWEMFDKIPCFELREKILEELSGDINAEYNKKNVKEMIKRVELFLGTDDLRTLYLLLDKLSEHYGPFKEEIKNLLTKAVEKTFSYEDMIVISIGRTTIWRDEYLFLFTELLCEKIIDNPGFYNEPISDIFRKILEKTLSIDSIKSIRYGDSVAVGYSGYREIYTTKMCNSILRVITNVEDKSFVALLEKKQEEDFKIRNIEEAIKRSDDSQYKAWLDIIALGSWTLQYLKKCKKIKI